MPRTRLSSSSPPLPWPFAPSAGSPSRPLMKSVFLLTPPPSLPGPLHISWLCFSSISYLLCQGPDGTSLDSSWKRFFLVNISFGHSSAVYHVSPELCRDFQHFQTLLTNSPTSDRDNPSSVGKSRCLRSLSHLLQVPTPPHLRFQFKFQNRDFPFSSRPRTLNYLSFLPFFLFSFLSSFISFFLRFIYLALNSFLRCSPALSGLALNLANMLTD